MERLSCYDHKNNKDIVLYVHDNSELKTFEYIMEDIFGYPLVICDIESNTNGKNNNGLYIKIHNIKDQISYDTILMVNTSNDELEYTFVNNIISSEESIILYNMIHGHEWYCTMNDKVYKMIAYFDPSSRFINIEYEISSIKEMIEYLEENKSNIYYL